MSGELWVAVATAAGVVVALLGLLWTGYQQNKAIKLQADAIQVQTTVAKIDTEARMRREIEDAIRRFENAKQTPNKNWVDFEGESLLTVIEAYLRHREELGAGELWDRRIKRVVRQLGSRFCGQENELLGPKLTENGFEHVGKLVDKLGVTSSVGPCV